MTETPAQTKRRERWMDIYRTVSATHCLPIAWLLAFSRKETNFQNIRSSPGLRDDVLGGAWGPMQITSETAKTLGYRTDASLDQRGKAILKDPAIGIDLGAQFLVRLRERVGDDLWKIAVAYNAGPGAVLKNKIPKSTRELYAPAVIRYVTEYIENDIM